MRTPGGYAVWTHDNGRIVETDSTTCGHCQFVTFVPVKADPATLGGLCKVCMRLICQRCVTAGSCTPFEIALEQSEARDRFLRSAGLIVLLGLLLAAPVWAQSERVVVNGVSCEVTRPAKHDTRVYCDNGGTDGLRDTIDAIGKVKREKLKKVRDPRKLWMGKSWKAEPVQAVFPPERDPVPVAAADGPPVAVASDVALDAAITIDNAIVWSQAAQTALGGAANALATAVLATALTNEGYANSGSPNIRFRLVGTGLVNYLEGQGFGAFTLNAQVNAIRNATGADLIGGMTLDNECGIGNLGGYYSISHVNCVTAHLTYPHEAGGHNLRMHHQPLTGGAPACDTTAAYNCGHQSADGAVRDMLAYGGGRQRLYSNPSVPFFGRTEPSGTIRRDNARTLRENALATSNWKAAVVVAIPAPRPSGAQPIPKV